jgi:hypothetical protein
MVVLYCEYVDGRKSSDDEKPIDAFLDECESLLKECGLPTWQVSRFNPSRRNNVVVDKNSNYKIIDFESGVPFPPWKFDEVEFRRLKSYVKDIKSRMPENEYKELLFDINQCEHYTKRWKDSELAVFRRIRKKPKTAYDAYIEYAKKTVQNKINNSIERLSERYELDENKIAKLYNLDPVMLHHLSAHIAISLATPSLDPASIVVSALARCGYTLSLRKKAEIMNDENGKKLHNWKVAIFSLLPKAGAFSYLFFYDFTASAVLINQFYYEKIGRHLPILKDLPLFKQLIINKMRK